MGLEEVDSDTLRPGLQNRRFFSLARDVKSVLHSFLLAFSFWPAPYFITTPAVVLESLMI